MSQSKKARETYLRILAMRDTYIQYAVEAEQSGTRHHYWDMALAYNTACSVVSKEFDLSHDERRFTEIYEERRKTHVNAKAEARS